MRERAFAVALLAAAALAPQAVANGLPPEQQVGTLMLKRCADRAAFCTTIDRPLDPTGVVPGRTPVYFEFYPHTRPGRSEGTLVAAEGGPGYATTESRDEYLALYRPLLATRDLVLMDYRGTGRSGVINCHALQTASFMTEAQVADCGQSLGPRASLYSAAFAADDLAAILDGLSAHPVDLYGDSYGTFFAQVFAVRYPALVRSAVLDGAYPFRGEGGWYPSYPGAMRDKFSDVCQRSHACRDLPGTTLERIGGALALLRRQPSTTTAFDADGRPVEFKADAARLATVMFGQAPAYASLAELDAAARAFVAADRAPLLRLMAETVSEVKLQSSDPRQYSYGFYFATTCQDAEQIYDMALPPGLRARERDALVAERAQAQPDAYAPFTLDEYRGMPIDYSFIDGCVSWPVTAEHPPGLPIPADAPMPKMPMLVISGDLDDLTTVAMGAAATHLYPGARQLIVVNGLHVNALPHGRNPCIPGIVRAFIVTLEVPDTHCAAETPPVRLVPIFARHLDEMPAARPLPDNEAQEAALKAAAAAVATAGDVLRRVNGNSSGRGVGLRGGTFRIVSRAPTLRIRLNRVQFTEDLAVSGRLTVPHAGMTTATLRIAATGGLGGRLKVSWRNDRADPVATIHGVIGSARLSSAVDAP